MPRIAKTRRPKTRHYLDPLVLSSWLFCVPALLWAMSGYVIEAFVAAAASFVSVAHHRREEASRTLRGIDQALCAAAVVLTSERYYVVAMQFDMAAVAVAGIAVLALRAQALGRAAEALDRQIYLSVHLSQHLLLSMGGTIMGLAVLYKDRL